MLSELRAIAPLLGAEFADVRIVDVVDVPAVVNACVYGFAVRAGEAPGDDRPLVAINSATIERDAIAGRVEACTRSVFIHELGHLATLEPFVWSDFHVELIGDQMATFREERLRRASLRPQPESYAVDPSHDDRFVRAALHVFGRAEQLGIDASPRDMFTSCGAGWMSDVEHYLQVLRGEIIELRGELYADILATDPPAAFDELWAGDVAHYHQNEEERCNYLQTRLALSKT